MSNSPTPQVVTTTEPEIISRHTKKFPNRSESLPGIPPQPVSQPKPASSVQVRVDESRPEATDAPSDPSATTVFLPSRCEFYNFSSISLKRPKGFHQAKFHRAAVEQKDRHVADALSSLMPTGIRSEELTIPDFYFVMYWLRLNCYTRTDLVHRGVCNNPAHVHAVKEGRKDKDTLITIEVISKSRLEEIQLPEDYLEGFETELTSLSEQLAARGYALTAPRMFDVIELAEEYTDSPNFTEIAYLADRASCLMSVEGKRTTLRERIQVVEDLEIDSQDMLEEWRIRCSSYGVKESIRFKCKECGADVENPISISAHSFL